VRLTKTQVEALESIRDGRPHGFGYGCGNYRVALRALYLRAPSFVSYQPAKKQQDELFTITPDGIAALNRATV
jgi:hypothetical protein